jgi:hypothetical protein
VPLHLKLCPNCSKVDQVTAKVCAACGAVFPPIALAPEAAAVDAAVRPRPPAAPPAATNRAWPLILVALAAGGIPLLWMYRANMPLPKAWQLRQPTPAVSAVAPTPLAAPVPAAPVAEPAAAAPVVAPVPAAASADQPATGRDADNAAKPEPAAKKPSPAHASRQRAVALRARPAAAKAAPAAKEAAPVPRECTEAVAALGLCDPQQGKK